MKALPKSDESNESILIKLDKHIQEDVLSRKLFGIAVATLVAIAGYIWNDRDTAIKANTAALIETQKAMVHVVGELKHMQSEQERLSNEMRRHHP